ncbi:hypothetical protein GE278_08040 [Enterobacteriaceae bacterium Kacie_13]|nr:hypothetical protein GE278_08040 [Enterobacteriaceae bacterium Kacie_13]
MQDKINILINQYGGKHNKLVQADYIKNNQWGRIDPTKRKGAWVSSFYNPTLKQVVYGLDDGVYAGLVSAYLATGRH